MRTRKITNQQLKAFLITLLEMIKKSGNIKEVETHLENLIKTL